MWHLNNSSQKLNLKYESPASHPWVTRLLRSGAIESPASRWKMRVPREAKLSRDDRPLLYHGLAISNTCSHAKNRNDPNPITWSKVALHEDAFFAVAILGGGWLQSPASDGPPCLWLPVAKSALPTHLLTCICCFVVICVIGGRTTVKPVYNDHLMGYFSAFWCSSRWPRAT